MNARLGFAIAAHLDPQVLVIDEVLAVGDLAFQQKCYERLAEFRRSGVPIVFVSHNLQAVASVCDRGMLLRAGQAPLFGGVSEILATYTSGVHTPVDPRISACSATLTRRRDGEPLLAPVAPHEELALRLSLRTEVDLVRCRMTLQITRSDGIRMFDGACRGEDATPADIPAGTMLECTVRFRANLLRGTYLVGAVLLDAERRWPNVKLPNLASFVVDERESYAGCVAVDPEMRLVLARPEGRAAPHPAQHG